MSEKSFKTDRLLRIRDHENKLGVKKSTICKMTQEGEFPEPVKISERARGWRESQVDAEARMSVNIPAWGEKSLDRLIRAVRPSIRPVRCARNISVCLESFYLP